MVSLGGFIRLERFGRRNESRNASTHLDYDKMSGVNLVSTLRHVAETCGFGRKVPNRRLNDNALSKHTIRESTVFVQFHSRDQPQSS